MARSIKCIFINVNSIVSRHRRHYLRIFLDRHRPDILLVAEHKLSPGHRIDFAGYLSYRQNRHGGRGGGTAVFVKDDIRSERVVLNTGNVESTAVRIGVGGTAVTVVAAYLRPQETLAVSDFDAVLNLARDEGVLIGADFNAKHPYWGGTVTNPSGDALRTFLLSCPHIDVCRTDGATRITQTSSSFIDYFLASASLDITTSGAGLRTLDFESDHRAVEISIGVGGHLGRDRPTFYDFDKMDRRLFNRRLELQLRDCVLPIDRNVTIGEIDGCIGTMSEAFKDAMELSMPKIPVGNRGLLKLSPVILGFIKEKKRLRRIVQRSEDPGRVNIIKADIRNLDRIIQGAIAIYEQDYWTKYLEGIQVNNMTYRQLNRATGFRRRRLIPNLEGTDGAFIADDKGKADLLADGFHAAQGRGRELQADVYVDSVERGNSVLIDRNPLVMFGEGITANGDFSGVTIDLGRRGFVNPSDIGIALKRRANKRTSGMDGIPDIVLKRTMMVTWNFLAILLNHCINLGYFPVGWKGALVVPILKPGTDPGRAGSYRPISLLSPFGKLLEYFMLRRIRDKISGGGILADCQFGFRGGHSTSHALMVFSDYVTKGLNGRHATIAVSLDFSKAFDTAWQGGILHKMMTIGFDHSVCRMVADFLKGRTFSVKVGDQLSDTKVVVSGVPQGSLLGPVLYNLFVSDIPQPPLGDLLLVYADDILIAASGPRAAMANRRLNSYLEVLSAYFHQWGLRLNVGKCNSMIIKGRRGRLFRNERRFEPLLKIGADRLVVKDRFKYLGVIFTEKFEFYRHIDYVLEKVKRVYWMYHHLIGRKGGLTPKVRLLIYFQIIRPLISYAFPVWFGISSAQMERLRVWERRIFTACLGLRPEVGLDGTLRRPSCARIYREVGAPRIDNFLVDSALKFLENASSLGNRIVDDCFSHARNLESVLGSRYLSPIDLLTLRNGDYLYRDADLMFYHRRIDTFDLDNPVYNTNQ